MHKVFTPFTIKIIILIYFLLFLATLVDRPPHIDDLWLGEQAYWLSDLGYVKSELFRGLLNYEIGIYVYHKLFICIGAGLIFLFGWSLPLLKSISIITLLASLVLIGNSKPFHEKRLFVIMMLLVNPLIIHYAFTFRPELTLMFTGLLSYLFIWKFVQEEEKYLYLILAAIFAGVCSLVHLNGLIFIGAGSIFLLFHKYYFKSVLFGFVAVCVASLYFYDVFLSSSWQEFLFQFKNDPAVNEKGANMLWKFIAEHRRYFHDWYSSAFSILLFGAILLTFKNKKVDINTKYLLCLMFFLAIFPVGKTTKYLIPIFPYAFLQISASLKFLTTKKLIYKTLIFIFFSIYFMTGMYEGFKLVSTNYDYKVDHREMKKVFPENTTNIIAPMHLIFNEITNYNIQGLHFYQLQIHRYKDRNFEKLFFQKAKDYNIDVIILPEKLQDDYYTYPKLPKSDPNHIYEIKEIIRGYRIYVRKSML